MNDDGSNSNAGIGMIWRCTAAAMTNHTAPLIAIKVRIINNTDGNIYTVRVGSELYSIKL